MVCEQCKIDYPKGLVNKAESNEGMQDLCGICALAELNRVLGVDRDRFHGPMAEAARQAAIKFRKEHGHAL